MLDTKTVMPQKYIQLVQMVEKHLLVARVLKYDSSKCVVLAANKDGIMNSVSFILRSPAGHYFVQRDRYKPDGSFIEHETIGVVYIPKESAINNFLDGPRTANQRMSFEDAFGFEPEES